MEWNEKRNEITEETDQSFLLSIDRQKNPTTSNKFIYTKLIIKLVLL